MGWDGMKSSGESSRQGKDQVREKSTERDGYMDMKKGFEIVHCTCNHQENVLGIDRLPCFGWQMRSDEPGDIQTAGRIIVSADFDNVQMGKGDVWDSGWIEGSENVSVSYQGKALEPRTRYYWRVMAKNRSGETAQSAISFFETGKMEEAWKAKWISAPFLKMDKTDAGAPYLRRTFSLRGRVQSARMYICGLGYYEAFIEGCIISENLLEPPFTKYDALSYYRVYDVTEYIPAAGQATLGVVLGNGWYNCFTEDAWNIRQADWRAIPKLLCELYLVYEDGTQDCICSDGSWKTASGPITFNSIRNGEYYDARLELPGWNESGYVQEGWQDAVVVRGAGGELRAAEVQPIRVMEELEPVSCYRTAEGHWIFDLGQNFAGKVRLMTYGPTGCEIILRYSEELTQDRQHVDQKHLSGFVRSGEFQTDRYRKKSDEPEEWTPQFVYHGFRYVEVEGLPEELPGPCIKGLVMHTSFCRTGTFSCSDETLTVIQKLCHWSSISNCQGVPTDCPHREKNAWTGDAGVVADQLLLNYDVFLFLEKWMDDLCLSQRPNGCIPWVCPSTGWGYNWGNGPDWSMVLTTLPWALYEQTGDVSILKRYYPYICRHFEFMSSMAVDNIVDYGIGDWCAPFEGPALAVNMGSFRSPVALTDTACYYRSACILSKMSRILGYEDPYRVKSEEIKEALLNKFVDPETGEVAGDCQTSDGCVAFHHLLDPEVERRLMERLAERIKENGWHIDYGILGSKYVLNMLGEYGRTDVIYKMLTRKDYPGYLYWVENGCTTLAECWNLGGSHNHYMFSDVSAVFYRYFAGIRPCQDEAAWRRFILAPALHLDIKTLSCSVESPHGKIAASWKKEGETVTFTAEIPFGTTARLCLPDEVCADENGKLLESGRHEFCWKLKKAAK